MRKNQNKKSKKSKKNKKRYLMKGGALPVIRHFQEDGLLNRMNEYARSIPITQYANDIIENIAMPYGVSV